MFILPPFDLADCDPVCHECVKIYNEKYARTTKKWDIPCRGIPKEILPAQILDSLSSSEKEKALAAMDPVYWAHLNFGWEPRWYQGLMLRCTSRRKVSRCGRQVGKSEALAIFTLYQLYTNKEFRIALIAPQKIHVDQIFERMGNFIRRNPALSNAIVRNVKAPNHQISLANGSTVLGLSAGGSGGESISVRGQPLQLLIFDEGDYLSGPDFDSAMATIINSPAVATVWLSSTPTGKRERFWKSCVTDPSYREFHFPSQVNPQWTEDLDKEFKFSMSQLAYLHEIRAEFAEQVEGVYQRKFIDIAKTDYKYSDMRPIPNWIYCVGVDWNDVQIGTRIIVVGRNPTNGKYRIVDKHTVSREGWNQVAAIQKIKEVNKLWRPTWIYVDQGFGGTQIEMLHYEGVRASQHANYGPNHPDAALRKIVKGYDFGSKIETHDLVTKEKIKKAAKVFLVENSVRRFEHEQLEFPDQDKELESQLLGYIVSRISQSGNPVYAAGNKEAGDHDIDALNLALVAFTLELTEIGSPHYTTKIGLIDSSLPATIEQVKRKKDEDNIFGIRIVKNERITRKKEMRSRAPMSGRDNLRGDWMQGKLPAAHCRVGSRKLWSYPGFSRDEPPPEKPSRGFSRPIPGRRSSI